MLTLAYTLHRGKVCRQQQDCILIDGAIHQVPVVPITAATLTADEALLAVADGVACSGGDRRIAPQRASRIVLEELAKAVRDRPEWLQDSFVANRHVRQVQARLSDRLADNPETRGAASTLAVAHVRGRRAAILNVGDSRVYRANRAGRWWRLSKDHTVLQGMIDRGEASPDTEYASLYGMLAHVLCADAEEGDFAIHRVVVTLEPGAAVLPLRGACRVITRRVAVAVVAWAAASGAPGASLAVPGVTSIRRANTAAAARIRGTGGCFPDAR